ncbi:hypothetical protein MRS44_012641 [Fusarium solani]|uniref:uncharacterized protein n=1 Tax=Fusarium solani TaxID=169388 RepID=UPI0032C400A5|nr:hypothetical protein MRS44_012641 [Fusarium solani]
MAQQRAPGPTAVSSSVCPFAHEQTDPVVYTPYASAVVLNLHQTRGCDPEPASPHHRPNSIPQCGTSMPRLGGHLSQMMLRTSFQTDWMASMAWDGPTEGPGWPWDGLWFVLVLQAAAAAVMAAVPPIQYWRCCCWATAMPQYSTHLPT